MRRIIVLIVIISVSFFSATLLYPEIKVKIRDITYVDGLKENQVFGFGLVVGLQGTGDTKAAITLFTMKNLLKNLGLEHSEDFDSKNIASVIITAKLQPFVRIGDRVDVTISSIGDARSLEGGILIQSPLRGADGKIYIVAQGPLTVGRTDRRARGVKTVAYITNGGIVERGIDPEFVINDRMNLVLKKWDFSLADQIVKEIAGKFPESKPSISKNGMVEITVPKGKDVIELLSEIEKIEITPSYAAKVIINEKDGTIVMGGDVKISEVLVSKEGITVKVEEGDRVSSVAHLKETSTVKDLIDALHHIGATTADIISIVKALKDAGALHADLIIK
jgi:flagellar P-ring protein precursor FlgI